MIVTLLVPLLVSLSNGIVSWQKKILWFIFYFIASPPNNRVVGGSDANHGDFPFIVSLRASSTNSHFCGGSLITPKTVLTAAHCVLSYV